MGMTPNEWEKGGDDEMTAFRILLIVVSASFAASAHAQPKRDVLGFYLGMTKADFLKNAQTLGLNACRWVLDNDAGIEGKSPETSPWIQIHSCPNDRPGTIRYTADFTRYLAPNLLTGFSYQFDSKKTIEGVDVDVSQQFGVKSKDWIKFGIPIGTIHDLGEGIELTLGLVEGYYEGRYELSFSTSKYNAGDKKAKDEKQNRNAPPLKF